MEKFSYTSKWLHHCVIRALLNVEFLFKFQLCDIVLNSDYFEKKEVPQRVKINSTAEIAVDLPVISGV